MLTPPPFQGRQPAAGLQTPLARVKQQITLLKSELESMEARLNSGITGQMLQLQLQDSMNKQSQAMTMLSSLMKAFHDQAKAIINNLK